MKNTDSQGIVRGIVFALCILAGSSAFAKDYTVNSVSTFTSAQSAAIAGDVIIWKNGTYTDASFSVEKDGITVRSETPGGVTFSGSTMLGINASHTTFSGFQFIGGDIGSGYIVTVVGNNNILSQLNFNGYLAKKYVSIADGTQYNEVSYCNFENKPVAAVIGCTIQINTSPTVPGYHKIRYCSFQNYPGAGGDNGNEPIRIGLGAEATNNSRCIVEYCYFNNTGLGDGEAISLKCCENVVRYCTNDNNPQGMFVFRNGDRNVAYGNFFINGSGGIRVKEAIDTYCYNNYFETAGTGGSANAITLVYVSPKPSNVNFIHNTFVECGDIDLGGTGPVNVKFVNNIFKKSSGNIFTNANGQTTWTGNIYTGTPGITIPSGMTKAEPLLAKNADGYYDLTATSPAINHADSNYSAILDIANVDDDPSIMLDIAGRPRPVSKILKDVGCEEYTSGTTINKPLKLVDVGPSYLKPSAVATELQTVKPMQLLQNYPNPFNPATNIVFAVSERGKTTITIFNVLGEKIATLFNDIAMPGKQYTVPFNASMLPSGVYFSRLVTADKEITKKIIFIK